MPRISNQTLANTQTIQTSLTDQAVASLSWFAVYVQSRQERIVASSLMSKGFEICLPMTTTVRQWSDRRKLVEEPVFPGYLFCKFDAKRRTPVLRTAGVVQILGAGRHAIPLEPKEI